MRSVRTRSVLLRVAKSIGFLTAQVRVPDGANPSTGQAANCTLPPQRYNRFHQGFRQRRFSETCAYSWQLMNAERRLPRLWGGRHSGGRRPQPTSQAKGQREGVNALSFVPSH